MERFIMKKVKIPALVNWSKVEEEEAKGKVYKDWNEYPKISKPSEKVVVFDRWRWE